MQVANGIEPRHLDARAPKTTGEIRLLQYGRGIAALLVVLFHSEGLPEKYLGAPGFDNIFRGGHSGVEFFFLLSGFIIFTSHHRDVGQPSSLGNFYLKRAIRLLPMFWLVVIPMGLLMLTVHTLGADRALTAGKFLLDVLLIPRDELLILPPAWTLQHELVFYLLFGLLIVNKYLGMAVIAIWQIACLAALAYGFLPGEQSAIARTLLGYHNLGFALGMLIALLHERVNLGFYRNRLIPIGALAIVGVATCFVFEWRFGSLFPLAFTGASTLTYFSLYSLVIVALLSAENKARPILDTTLGALGAASYVLYLIHEPLQSVIFKIILLQPFRFILTPLFAYALCVAISVVVALVMHYYIERPVLHGLQRLFGVSSRRTIESKS